MLPLREDCTGSMDHGGGRVWRGREEKEMDANMESCAQRRAREGVCQGGGGEKARARARGCV